MTVVYNLTVRNNRLTQVVNAIDAGAGNGKLVIGTAGMGTILSTITLNKPCGVVAGGVLTFSGVPINDPSAAATGTAAAAIITDSTATTVISGLTVGLAGTDIIISLATITAGSIVTFTSGTITGN